MRIVWLLLVFCVAYSTQQQNAAPATKHHKAEKVAMIQTVKDLNALRDAYNKRDFIMALIKFIDLYDDMELNSHFLVTAFLKTSRHLLVGMHKIYKTVFPDKPQEEKPGFGFGSIFGGNDNDGQQTDDKSGQSVIDKVSQYKDSIKFW